ncbi:NAD(P)-binding protein [Mycena sanguinolenta]|uniref:NAD(P)-binding protein n=1 Tax=Mycena sanguinolenta TaxID=230812 RepID=A0A8H7CL81_9AGAR|nr:NAD(P)-binding protein [Mycena sanguinolenta]
MLSLTIRACDNLEVDFIILRLRILSDSMTAPFRTTAPASVSELTGMGIGEHAKLFHRGDMEGQVFPTCFLFSRLRSMTGEDCTISPTLFGGQPSKVPYALFDYTGGYCDITVGALEELESHVDHDIMQKAASSGQFGSSELASYKMESSIFSDFQPPRAMPTFGLTSTAEEVASAFSGQIKGKNVLITGTSINGIGFEAARVLAIHGAGLIIITGLQLTEDALKKEAPSANIRQLVLNLSSLADVRKAAAEILINNAASSARPFELTVDGFEHQIATAHLGHFLFTALILPKVLAAPSTPTLPRVLFTASGVHVAAGVNLETLEHPNAETYQPALAYAQAKSANILTAGELARRGAGKLKAYSLTPGPVVTNFVTNEVAKETLIAGKVILEDGTPNPEKPWKTIPQGAAVILTAAFDPSLEDKSGSFIQDCVESNGAIAPHASDPVQAEKLWSLSEKLVGTKFEV